jgi:hypothetical protein
MERFDRARNRRAVPRCAMQSDAAAEKNRIESIADV